MRDNISEGTVKGHVCNCFWCKKEYFVRLDAYDRQMSKYGHVCCKRCFGNEPIFKAARKRVMLENNPFKGKTHTEETRKLMAIQKTGMPVWNVGLTKETNNSLRLAGIKVSATRMAMDFTKDKNPNWRGGSSIFNRDNDFFTKWLPLRDVVLERDVYRCWKCDCRVTDNTAEIHHLLSKTRFPEFRYDELNCIALCKNCHKEFHKTYGLMQFTKGDTIEWINISRQEHEKLIMC